MKCLMAQIGKKNCLKVLHEVCIIILICQAIPNWNYYWHYSVLESPGIAVPYFEAINILASNLQVSKVTGSEEKATLKPVYWLETRLVLACTE